MTGTVTQLVLVTSFLPINNEPMQAFVYTQDTAENIVSIPPNIDAQQRAAIDQVSSGSSDDACCRNHAVYVVFF